MRAWPVGCAVMAAVALGACAEEAPRTLYASSAFHLEVDVPVAVDDRARLAQTDRADCDGGGSGRSLHLAAVGSALQLVGFGEERVAFIADADGRQLRRFALERAEELDAVAMPGAPSALVVGEDGRLFVTLADSHRVAVLTTGASADAPVALRCTRPTPQEPVGLATYPGGLVVTSRWGQALSLYRDDAAMKRERVIDLPRDPASVGVTEGRAVVSHAFGGRMSVVDLSSGKRKGRKLRRRENLDGASVDRIDRIGTQAFALVPLGDGEFALPNVMVDPGNTRAVASTAYYGGTAEVPIAAPLVARVDARQKVLVSMSNPAQGCLLPKAAAYDPEADEVLVGCTGLDVVQAIGRGDGKERTHDRRAWTAKLSGAPAAMAVDARSRQLVAWSQFDAAITVVALDDAHETEVHQLEPPASLDPQIARGRRIFHEAGKRRLSFDGRACASCHPDGRDDAVTWVTPKGPRQTPMLVDRLEDTAPFGWDGSRGDLHGYIRGTLRRLGGDGLSGEDRSALIAYLTSLRAPTVEAPLTPAEEKGEELFASSVTGCTSCHAGGGMTDRMGHDVGSRAEGDDGVEFDTPSLRHITQSAPYYHDGRYRSLRALLTDRHSRMGRTSHLSSDEVDALEAYLRRL